MKVSIKYRELIWGLVSAFAATIFLGLGFWAEQHGAKNAQFIFFLLLVLAVISGFFSIAVGWKNLLSPKKPDPAAE